MPVDAFARMIFVAAHERGVEFAWKPRFPWLSGKGHIEPAAQSAPARVVNRLATIHEALGGDASLLELKTRHQPPCDFLWGERTIIELDEFQHFSTPRLRSLDFYDGLQVGFSLTRYKQLCNDHRARANKYRASKVARDFPILGSRTAQRAYLDAVRDLLGPAMGYRVIRIPAPDEDVDAAVHKLLAELKVAC